MPSLGPQTVDAAQTAGFGAMLGTVDPSGHVLAAVSQVRDQSGGGGSLQGSGASGMPSSVGAGLGVDVSLHVLPAVSRVSSETRAVASSADSIASGSLAADGSAPLLGTSPIDNGNAGLPAAAAPAARSTDTPPSGRQPDDEHGREPNDDAPPADAGSTNPQSALDPAKPLARRSFADQLREAAASRSTRHYAHALQRSVAPASPAIDNAEPVPPRRGRTA